MSIPDELARLRDKNNLTQEEAADECGVPLGTWRTWEQGRHEPSVGKMEHVRNVLGVTGQSHSEVEKGVSQQDIHKSHVASYPVADTEGDEPPTAFLDDRLIDIDGGMPTPQHAKVHCANGALMGPYLPDRCRVLVSEQEGVVGPGRYLIRWKGGSEKVVAYLNRWGDESIILRRFSPREKVVIDHKDGDTYEHQDGRQFTLHVIGKVVYPPDTARQLTEEMLDKARQMFELAGGG